MTTHTATKLQPTNHLEHSHLNQSTKGILLLNVGTPDDTSVKSVRRYLRQFLSDKRVINIPWLLRWGLLNFVILPFRPKKSAEVYRKVWTKEGSPLLTISNDFAQRLEKELNTKSTDSADNTTYKVEIGMRYQNPSMTKALDKFINSGIDDITLVPMFPQYASASSGTALEEAYDWASKQNAVPSLNAIDAFYYKPQFIDAWGTHLKPHIEAYKPDHILFSYHGIPIKQAGESHLDETPGCTSAEPCPMITHDSAAHALEGPTRHCYRRQCYQTTASIVHDLKSKDCDISTTHSSAFQSRLGPTPWIKPYTDLVIDDLIEQGVKKLMVACPAFVADCLETLEEIGIALKEDWLEKGGEEFLFVPCLNSEDYWVEGFADIIKNS